MNVRRCEGGGRGVDVQGCRVVELWMCGCVKVGVEMLRC